MEKAFEEYKKDYPLLAVDLSNPLPPDQIVEDTPYVLIRENHIIKKPIFHLSDCFEDNSFTVNKVQFKKGEFFDEQTQLWGCFFFKTDKGETIYMTGSDIKQGWAKLYDFTEEYACK